MRIINLGPWVFYIEGKPQFDEHKVGKWMYFFNEETGIRNFLRRDLQESSRCKERW